MSRLVLSVTLSLTVHSGHLLFGAERVALVIGNNAYQHGVPLQNCVNDARLLTLALRAADFEVIAGEDLSLEAMEKQVLEFRRKAEGASAAWFFYAGHGVELQGENYLVPVDTKIEDEYQIKHKTLALQQVMAAMDAAKTPLKVVVLDCCRDNPLGRGWTRSSSSGGLGQVANAPEGTLIAFATAPGRTAADGGEKNSPYTTALAWAMAIPGRDVKDVFHEAGRRVLEATGKRQQPWINSSFFGNFVVLRENGGIEPPRMPSLRPEPTVVDQRGFAGTNPGEKKIVEVAPGIEMHFRWCPAGSFEMGSPAEERELVGKWSMDASDEVTRQVELTQGFWLAETEITQAQWQAVMKTNLKDQVRKALQDDRSFELGGQRAPFRELVGAERNSNPMMWIAVESEKIPMYFVNHEDSEEWCRTASRHLGVPGWKVSLPTEAQWEYACRAGTQGMTYAGDFEIEGRNNAPKLDPVGWYMGNSSHNYLGKGFDPTTFEERQYLGNAAGPRRAGGKQANAWGLYDMLGNIREWCSDWYGDYPQERSRNSAGASSGTYRVSRGGSWFTMPVNCRAGARLGLEPGFRFFDQGFRAALVQAD